MYEGLLPVEPPMKEQELAPGAWDQEQQKPCLIRAAVFLGGDCCFVFLAILLIFSLGHFPGFFFAFCSQTLPFATKARAATNSGKKESCGNACRTWFDADTLFC